MTFDQAFPQTFDLYRDRTDKSTYAQRPIKVSAEFRSEILDRYHILSRKGKYHDFYWKMMQYVLFSTYEDENAPSQSHDFGQGEERHLVCPHTVVAHLSGNAPYGGSFRSGDWLQEFSNNVVYLGHNFQEWNLAEERARVIRPHLDAELLQLIAGEIQKPSEKKQFYFHDGRKVNRANDQKIEKSRQSALEATNGSSLDQYLTERSMNFYPARELMDYLNSRPQTVRNRQLEANWPSVKIAAQELKAREDWTDRKRMWLDRTLAQIEGSWSAYYTWAKNSPRIYTIGVTVHLLPRLLRKIAFTNAIEFDLKACQLAIIAALWDIDSLKEKLKNGLSEDYEGKDIWDELLLAVDLAREKERYKPILKTTVYSIIFGMRFARVKNQLSTGIPPKEMSKNKGSVARLTSFSDGIGEAKAKHLLAQEFFVELFEARTKQEKKAKNEGYIKDAFGHRITVTDNVTVKSAMSYVAQSYELRLMKSVFEVVREQKQVYIFSFLHDGMTLQFTHPESKKSQIKEIKQAVESEIALILQEEELNIYTTLSYS